MTEIDAPLAIVGMTVSMDELIRLGIAFAAIIMFVAANAMGLVYAERKIAAFIQRRPGPYEVGPHGILQIFCDVPKLLSKQLLRPSHADPFLFWLAPVLAMLPILVLFLPLPFSPLLTGWNPDLGLLLILAFSGVHVLSVLLAGWSSNNKYSLYGAARGVAQNVAYEIPLLMAVLAIAFQHGTLSLSSIVDSQGSMPWQWNIFTQPLAFCIYWVSVFGETNRTPFDLAETESELTGGFHTEYSGMGFGLFFMAEYASMVVVCAVAATLFLGGWKGPFYDGVWWLLAKTYALLFLMMWVRWTYPRIRIDQLLTMNWKWLIPLATLNLIGTVVLMKVL